MLLIRHIEERSLNALPALRTIYYDGWLLRFADGYTRRANSVNALYPPSLPLDEKIAHCEQAYTQAGRDVIFKLTDAVQPAHLDAVLAEKGYAKTAETGVQTLALAAATVRESSSNLTIAARLTPAWLADYRRFNRVPEQHARTLRRMLAGIQPRAAFATLTRNGAPLAVGLGVLERGWLGLFDIVVHEQHRGQGVGAELVRGLLAWGEASGAAHAYLQVVSGNAPALRLYQRLGFREQYCYWYRVKPREAQA